jgi:transcriptional regulator with XRE-family HTH domain
MALDIAIGFCHARLMGHMLRLSQGQRIRLAREAAGLEQGDLAEALHISRTAISSWELDRTLRPVKFAYLKLIAEACDVPLEFLEGREMAFSPIEETALVTSEVTHHYLHEFAGVK